MTAMNAIRICGDMLHLGSIMILLLKIYSTKNCKGISLKTQLLYFIVFMTRYMDLVYNFNSLYNSVMKVIFIASTGAIVYLMKFKSPFKNTYDATQDSFPILFLIIPCFVLGVAIMGGEMYIYEDDFYFSEVLWIFSIYLESVAILPQLWVVRDFAKENRGFVENLTSHYVFALGGYRVLYMLNWIFRFMTEPRYRDWIAWTGGIIQTANSEGKVMSLPI